ncbi:hypothetical protein K435DRAFT_641407 [Dendrothele bispora CBS 962.96]|uniref:Uncharacterized protein n=1 Tax=Dendrothele bispora (strain CBS 962.96) TaxID=1314807 RepID=A0A4S8MZZ4_DENBC|nr:hypothetical protein K435DRAFT_641407 [Dendrothele bispora CBS 962.96]
MSAVTQGALGTIPLGRTVAPRGRSERYQYTYNLIAGSAPLQFIISVEPAPKSPGSSSSSHKYVFRLSLKVDKTERPLGESVTMNLTVDPRHLEFVVFVFPGKSTLPAGCLWCYRVWLRVDQIDHRLFGDDELWVGKDPDFSSVANISMARLRSMGSNSQMYEALVGRAKIGFHVRWQHIAEGLYRYSIDYEVAGVGATLVDDFKLILHGDPKTVTFLIYTVPMNSVPAQASHRLRIWLKTYLPSDPSITPQANFHMIPFNDSFVYQRIYKSDTFKVGFKLDFSALGGKMVMGTPNGPPKAYSVSHASGGRLERRSTGDSAGSGVQECELG